MQFESEFARMTQQHKQSITRRGRQILSSDRPDHKFLRQCHKRQALRVSSESEKECKVLTPTRVFQTELFCCKKDLHSLSITSLNQLKLETHHSNCYVILQTLEVPYHVTGTVTIVQDHLGYTDILLLNRFTDCSLLPNKSLPIGTILAIKEPYYTFNEENQTMIRVDSPSDVVILHPGDVNYNLLRVSNIEWRHSIEPLNLQENVFHEKQTVNKWKRLGDSYYLKREYQMAIEAYERGIIESTDMDSVCISLYLNKSSCFLSLERYKESLDSVKLVLSHDLKNEKAIIRAVKACYYLRDFSASLEYMKSLRLHHPSPCHESENGRLLLRLKEQELGKYDLTAIFKHVSTTLYPRLDCANYMGPVQVVQLPGKGRGVIATRDISPGKFSFSC